MIGVKEAKELIDLARDAITSYITKKPLKIPSSVKTQYSEDAGVFVTLKKKNQLRGCIGFPEPIYPIFKGVTDAAISAAFSDPRFPPLDKDEFKEVSIEISLLSRPTVIEVRHPQEYVNQIKIGRDGLLVRATFESGLLLPQVAVEQRWDAKTFLDQTCVKAGLPPNSWQDFDKCTVSKFEGVVFSEVSPNGKVVQIL